MNGLIFRGGIWGNPVKQFQKVAKSTVANPKIWTKVEFAIRKEKQEKLINQLKHMKQSKAHGVYGDQIRKLEIYINNMLIDKEIY